MSWRSTLPTRWILVVAVVTTIGCSSTGPSGQSGPSGPSGPSGSGPRGKTKAPMATDLDTPCSSDEDCTLVEACCGCGGGGKRLAIRKDAVSQYEASREQRCQGATMCPAVMSDHSSCNAEATCQNERCHVQPHMGRADPNAPPAP